MARSGVDETINRIRRQLRTAVRNEILTCETVLEANAAIVSIVFIEQLPAQLIAGTVLAIGTEELRVIDVDRSGGSCRVTRGWFDSVPEAHAANSTVFVNSRYSGFALLDEMVNEVQSWGNELYDVVNYEVNVAAGTEMIVMPDALSSMLHLVSVRFKSSGGSNPAWREVPGRSQFSGSGDWSAASSGVLFRSFEQLPTGTALITAAMPFDASTIVAGADLTTDTKIPTSMLEIVDLGVKARLLYDAANNDAQRQNVDENVDREGVPVASSIRLARNMRGMQRAAVEVQARRLRSRYPIRVTV
jgi:hypothetical protein